LEDKVQSEFRMKVRNNYLGMDTSLTIWV